MPAMILYNTTSNPKALNKDLTNSIQIETIKPYEPVSDLEGYVIVDYNSAYENMNYAAYDNDYYFITDREKIIGGKMKLYLRMDVLMSFRNDIVNCPIVALRSEIASKHNAYIQDGLRVTYANREMDTFAIGDLTKDDTNSFILVTVG
jgi:hypothetical protein